MLHLRTGEEIAGRYRLERKIGSGGMATVWLAEDDRLGRRVAVKLLSEVFVADPTFVRRFEREARIAARLTHPNLVTVLDLGTSEERPYLVMEYVEGETLAERLDRDPGGVEPRLLAIGLLTALDHIHAAGIVHRDVKPANVLLDERDEPRLTDFGIARMLDETGQITRPGQVLGTLRYMAPEITAGGEPTPRSDLYSLGIVITEAGGAIDPGLAGLMERLRDPDPERRPPSARSALRILEGGSSGSPATQLGPRTERMASSPLPSRPPIAGGGRRAQRAWAGLAIAILAGLVIAVGAISLGDGGGEGAGQGAGDQAAEQDAGPGSGSGEAAGEGDGSGDDASSAPTAAVPAPSDDPDPARGARLNDRGFALLGQGRADEAVPVLRRAVASFPEGTDDLNYAYSLYNLGRALREAGRPAQAVPVLERRLEIDNQRPTVRRELELARSEAG